jgi:hypothetical protein
MLRFRVRVKKDHSEYRKNFHGSIAGNFPPVVRSFDAVHRYFLQLMADEPAITLPLSTTPCAAALDPVARTKKPASAGGFLDGPAGA